MQRQRLIVGISGASGVRYGLAALSAARAAGLETHLVVTRAAEMTLAAETGQKAADLNGLADVRHPIGDVGAPIASGSFRTIGMIVAPCSIRSLSEIATGVTSTLLTRAADVALKERRKLVLMVRETPLHLGHLRSMAAVTEMGGIIFPPVPAFYAEPQTLDEVIEQTAARALDLIGVDAPGLKRWGEDVGRKP